MDIHPNTQDVQQQVPDNLILEMLHDDELYLIFKLLNLLYLIEIEKVCQRFKTIAQEVYKSHKMLNFNHLWRIRRSPRVEGIDFMFTVTEAMEITSRVASYVKKLKIDLESIDDQDGRIAEFWKNFTNLQAIRVDCINFKHMNNESLRKILKTLKNVELINDPPDELSSLDHDNLIGNFLNIPQLEKLKLTCVHILEGKFLAKLSNITVLSLNFARVNPQLFCQFCDKKPNLRSLNIIGCPAINTMCLKSIAANLQNLEELSFSFNYQVDSPRDYFLLADLTKIKHLKLYWNIAQRPQNILYKLLFAISTKNKLESLEFHDDCENPAAAEDMKRAIQSLKHLKKLEFSYSGCDWDDDHLSYLPCEKTLQRLIIRYNYKITSYGLSQLIARCPSIKIINISSCSKIDETLVNLILPHLKTRSHMLELNVNKENFPKEKFGKYFGINPSRLMLTFD